MAPSINDPGGVKNDPDEIRDGVVSDSTRFPGRFIDEQITEAAAPVQIVGQFQVSNSSFTEQFFIGSQDTTPQGLAFKPDGSQLYFIGLGNTNVYQYSLSTAFDISTASFVRSFDVSSEDTSPLGLVFKPDGGQMYTTGASNSNVYQYSLSTAFDISTASFVRSFDVSSEDAAPQGLAFKPDGSQLFIIGSSTASVYQYSLSTAFDISTATFSQSFDVSPQDSSPTGLVFKPDGSRMYISGSSNGNVYQYVLTTTYDISTASFGESFDVTTEDTAPRGLTFRADGSYLYVIGLSNENIYQYAVGFVGNELE